MSFNFEIKESEKLSGVWIIKPSISCDRRGTIWTAFLDEKIEQLLPIGMKFSHDKFSESCKNVLRGIHGDGESWKLVTSVFGEVHQVVVDCRKDSKTYLKWEKYIINKENQQLILIPPNMGNAYFVSSEYAVYYYKLAYTGKYIDATDQFTIPWNEPSIGIDWPSGNPILSDRDCLFYNKM